MANKKNNTATLETRRRLLLAAGEVFAERGFAMATIRDITEKAGASVASVNYHFGDKAELYKAVFQQLQVDLQRVIPPRETLQGDAETRLSIFVRHVLSEMLLRDRPEWEHVLWTREISAPSPAMLPLIENVVAPLQNLLLEIVAELSDPPASSEQTALQASSVMGQILYFAQNRPIIAELHPDLPHLWQQPDVEAIADHISRFTLGALGRLSKPRAHRASR